MSLANEESVTLKNVNETAERYMIMLVIFAISCHCPDIVNKSFDQVLISVRLLIKDPMNLFADCGGREFDFEFMLLFARGVCLSKDMSVSQDHGSKEALARKAHGKRMHLRQIKLVGSMLIAQPILFALGAPSIFPFRRLHQILDISIPLDFKADTDTPVKRSSGTVNFNVEDSDFNDLGQLLASPRICTNADFWLKSTIQVAMDPCWQYVESIWGQIVESIRLVKVGVGKRHSRLFLFERCIWRQRIRF